MVLAASFLIACTSSEAGPEESATPASPAQTAAPVDASIPVADSREEAVNPGPWDVGVTTFEVVDTTRPTAAHGDVAESPERRLTVEAWYPADLTGDASEDGRDAPVDERAAPYPLIVFAHGLSGTGTQSTTYTRHLASHGYVVVAPDFPLSRGGTEGGPRAADLVNQPGDVSFVIDRVLEFDADPGNRFEGAIDEDRIGLTGHSLGAYTTLLTVYGSNRDERIDAALPLSGSGCFMSKEMVGDTSLPIMLMTGSEDLLVPASGNRRAYDLANAPRYWVELIGGSHVRFADFDIDDEQVLGGLERLVGAGAGKGDENGCGRRPETSGETITLERQQELLRLFATPFFDAYLRGSDAALRFLQDDLPGLTEDAVRYEFDAD